MTVESTFVLGDSFVSVIKSLGVGDEQIDRDLKYDRDSKYHKRMPPPIRYLIRVYV